MLLGAACLVLFGVLLSGQPGATGAAVKWLPWGVGLLTLWALFHSRRSRRWLGATLLLALVAAGSALAVRQSTRYQIANEMIVPLTEHTNAEYPEDPANRSPHHAQYQGRRVRLIRKDDTHFDVVVEPVEPTNTPHIATITFHDVDVSLMTPSLPEWCKRDPGNTRIALTDRQWNRQQVAFAVDGQQGGKNRVEVSGGDGFERENLSSAELAKNCLNAGLWEVLLFHPGSNGKELYYQGWFTFPLGLYREQFERGTGLRYGDHWHYLEHWFDPAGTVVKLDDLRRVTATVATQFEFDPTEKIIAGGEQLRKRRTLLTPNLRTWGDFTDARAPEAAEIQFASFIPPGRYSVRHPWKNEYHRLATLKTVTLREIESPADAISADNTTSKPRHELELQFVSREGTVSRLFVSGFRWDDLPQLAVADYAKGMYLPMGIGVPPFFQTEVALVANPPHQSAYFSVLLDPDDRWIDHHKTAIDGPVLHRDIADSNTLHLYLLSYERHSLVRHVTVRRTAMSDGLQGEWRELPAPFGAGVRRPETKSG